MCSRGELLEGSRKGGTPEFSGSGSGSGSDRLCAYMLALGPSPGFSGGEVGRNFSAEKKKRRRRGRGSHVDIFVPGDISFESLGPSPVPVFLRVTVCHVLPKGS